MAVRQEVIGAADTARHNDIEVTVKTSHGRFRVEEEGKVMDRDNFVARPIRRQNKIGGMKEIERAAGKPFDWWPGTV